MKSSSTFGGSRGRLRLGRTTDGFDSAVAERVRLYLKVTFFINVFFCVASVLTVLGGQPYDPFTQYSVFGMAAVNGMAWFLAVRSRSPVASSPHVATLMTLMLSAVSAHIVTNNSLDPNPTRTGFFLVLATTFLLVLRSSLIPSRTGATALVGFVALSFNIWAMREHAVDGDRVFFIWLIVASIIAVGVTVVTSSTVYGLNRRMRAAAQLGQYEIERLLGRGGMGEVYLAKHALLNRPTAVKLLRDVSASSTRELFRHEVQTASGLTHPNTVEIYDYGRTPEGVFYFAMEYVEGATLDEVVMATGAMPPARAIHLLRQAAGALGEAHGRGLIHRDVKPSNLMLCERGGIFDTMKVMDFGLVRDLAEADPEDQGLTGTPLYLAPECILETGGAVPQTDVYALGGTAYFLLTGRPPFEATSLVELLSDHLASDPPSLDSGDATLDALVMRCLAKDPKERPTDAKELAEALAACDDAQAWTPRDADIWWAEHGEVITAYRPTDAASSTAPPPVHAFAGSHRRRPAS
jgi:eukaryotic-like serine/threonine-protein kinase